VSKVRRLPLAGSFVYERWQELEGPPHRRSEVPIRDFHLCGGLPIPFTRTDNHAGVAHKALTSMHRIGARGFSVDPTRRSLQNAGYRLSRIHLPRTRVNKGERKGRGCCPRPLCCSNCFVRTLLALTIHLRHIAAGHSITGIDVAVVVALATDDFVPGVTIIGIGRLSTTPTVEVRRHERC
jgi:hypothetical protein